MQMKLVLMDAKSQEAKSLGRCDREQGQQGLMGLPTAIMANMTRAA